tara:strand:+ start:2300 stop:2992 length:693 start_codon:yes stop_codon:yes gene_type:complete
MKQFKEEILSTIKSLKEAEDFITRKTGEDPTTQTITWEVDYTPNLKNLYTDINNVVIALEKLQRNNPTLESEQLLNLGKSLRNRFSRLLKKYNDLKEQSSTSQGGASFTPGTGEQYATPRAFNKNTNSKGAKNIYYYKLGWKAVPKKIKGSGLEVKKLYEGEINDFQQERIDVFSQIETELNNLSPIISNAKNSTIEYYTNNPGSFAIIRSTDLILDYIKNINQLLKGEK